MALTKVRGSGLDSSQEGAITFNEGSADVDFRVESNGQTHALFVDAGSDHVNINTSTDLGSTLNVNGDISVVNADSGLILAEHAADANGSNLVLRKSRNATLLGHTVVQSGDALGSISFQGSDGTDYHSGASISAAVDTTPGNNDMPGRLVFSTTANSGSSPAERMRLDESGRLLIGSTTYDNSNVSVLINSGTGLLFATANGDAPVKINRKSSDGELVELLQDSNKEGSLSVSGSTVTLVGFSGQHESSGIATNTAVGTVVSTIDELDTYASGDKKGQTRADHPKVKVSDTEGDKAVYGVVDRFNSDDKVIVSAVGIASIKVTGACAKGDLLESNGDGTAKVQSDDIVRSKTIGKVTIGNSSTDVKLVSCVLYCG